MLLAVWLFDLKRCFPFFKLDPELMTLTLEVRSEAFQFCRTMSHKERLAVSNVVHSTPQAASPGVVFKEWGFAKVNRWLICAFPVADCTLTLHLQRNLWELSNSPFNLQSSIGLPVWFILQFFYFVSSSVPSMKIEQYSDAHHAFLSLCGIDYLWPLA